MLGTNPHPNWPFINEKVGFDILDKIFIFCPLIVQTWEKKTFSKANK